ncbi:MAG: hypothetical protein J6J36_02565 [Clostridia bacterium]|nr:hypothetical protein [Clostridia bacterium]
MSEKKVSSAYTPLEELMHPLRTGNIIVGDTLFQVEKGTVTDSYQLSGKTISEKVRDARIQADLDNRKRIIVDTEGMYDEDTIADEGELVTINEAFERMSEEDRDDYESFAEYFASH